ncbi:MAG: hypothetical protein KUG77_10480 [Nannocystaceae bacterium]|nr:hypothetical protein [Nannocystaceae bacterium]
MSKKIVGLTMVAALVLTTGCEFWTDVTIPAADTTPPAGVARLLEINGDELDLFAFSSGETINYVTDDLDRNFVAVGAAWDLQGAKRVRMYQTATRRCVDGDIGAVQYIDMAPLNAEQAGVPGDVVETGVWTGEYISGDYADNCPGTTHLVSFTYQWGVEAENFFGQVVNGGSGSITFAP